MLPLLPRYASASSRDGAGNLLVSGGMADLSDPGPETTVVFTEDGNSDPGPVMPSGREQHCQLLIGTSVYVIGGYEQGVGDSNSMIVLEEGVWRELSAMPNTRTNHACIAYSGKIYAIGGSWNPTVDIYDPVSDSWEVGPSLPIPLGYAHAVNYQQTLYMVGGALAPGQFNSQVFTLTGNGEWQVLPGVSVEEPYRPHYPAPVLNREVLYCGI